MEKRAHLSSSIERINSRAEPFLRSFILSSPCLPTTVQIQLHIPTLTIQDSPRRFQEGQLRAKSSNARREPLSSERLPSSFYVLLPMLSWLENSRRSQNWNRFMRDHPEEVRGLFGGIMESLGRIQMREAKVNSRFSFDFLRRVASPSSSKLSTFPVLFSPELCLH